LDSLALAVTFAAGQLELRVVEDDPTDDKILACVVEGQVDYVVASDKHLLEIGPYAGIPIVTPRRFLELVEDPNEEPAS